MSLGFGRWALPFFTGWLNIANFGILNEIANLSDIDLEKYPGPRQGKFRVNAVCCINVSRFHNTCVYDLKRTRNIHFWMATHLERLSLAYLSFAASSKSATSERTSKRKRKRSSKKIIEKDNLKDRLKDNLKDHLKDNTKQRFWINVIQRIISKITYQRLTAQETEVI